jgi:Fur family ferric uptake transcriptional regulator
MKTKKYPAESVSLIFSEYLKSNGLRQTHERFAILSEIYLSDRFFSIHSLGERLAKRKVFVSRGTLYNTLDLLLNCGLVRRHQLGGTTHYEKANRIDPQDYLVLTDTKEILEFSDKQISTIQKNIEKLLNVEIYDHSLVFYGRRKTTETTNHEEN